MSKVPASWEKPCPVCGAAAFTWGAEYSSSARLRHTFRADDEDWGGQPLCLRRCDTCGNVQQFVRLDSHQDAPGQAGE